MTRSPIETSDIYSAIQAWWRDDKCPLIDGVLFDDGRLFEVDYHEVTIRGISGHAATLSGNASCVVETDPDFSSLARNDCVKDRRTTLDYLCGEGSWGGDGFVACIDRMAGRLRWIAFFQHSNPFVRLRLEGARIVAENNHGHLWSFKIENPTDFHVT